MLRAAIVAVLMMGGPSWALAQEDAEQLIRKGVELRAQKEDAQALALFEQAYAAGKSPRALAQIGLAEQALARWVPAETHLEAALAARNDPWIASNRAALEGARAVIEKNLGWLTVRANAAGAVVRVAGAEAELGRKVRVAAGEVVVEVSAAGFIGAEKRVTVAPRASAEVAVELTKAAATPAQVATKPPAAVASRPAPASAKKAKDGEASSEPVRPASAASPAPGADPAVDPVPPAGAVVASGPSDTSGLRTWAWVAAGTGAGTLTLGILLVAVAEEDFDNCEYDENFELTCPNPAQSAGIAMFVLTGVLGVTSGVLFAVSADDGTATSAALPGLPESCGWGLGRLAGEARGASCAWRF